MSSHSINAANPLQTALKHIYSEEKVKGCKQELNDSLKLDKTVYFESMKDFDLKMTHKLLRSINGKAKERKKMSYKITSLCSDFAIFEVFNTFFAYVYKIDNKTLNVSGESIFPGIHLSDFYVSQCKILSKLSKCEPGENSVDSISLNIFILL